MFGPLIGGGSLDRCGTAGTEEEERVFEGVGDSNG